MLLLSILIPILAVQATIYYDRYKDRRAHEFETNLEIARSVADKFHQFIDDILRMERVIAVSLSSPDPLSLRQINRMLEESADEYGAIRSFTWANPDGRVIASSREGLVVNIGERPYFKEILDGKETAVSDLILSLSTGEPIFTVSRGVRDQDNRLLGVIVAAVAADRLEEMMALDRFSEGGVGILDRNGFLVSQYPHVEFSWEERNLLKNQPLISEGLKSSEAIFSGPISDSTIRMTALAPIYSLGWVALASRPEKAAMAPAYSDLLYHAGLFFFVTCGAFLVAAIIAHRISSPAKELRRKAVSLGRGESTQPIRIDGPTELKELAESFNQMAEAITARELQIKRRAEEAEEGQRILEALMNSVPIGIAVVEGLNFHRAKVSKYGQELAGGAASSGIWDSFLDGQTQAKIEELTTVRSMLQGEALVNKEWVFRRPDGTEIPILCNSGPIRDGGGKIAGAVVAWQDISAIKTAQEALRESKETLEKRVLERTAQLTRSNERLQFEIVERARTEELLQEKNELLEGMFANVHFLVAYMDTRFDFIRVNKAYAEIENRDPEFFVGKNHFELYPNEENQSIFERVAESGKAYTVFARPFYYEKHPERGTTYWDWSLQPVKHPNGEVKGLVLSLIDVTARQEAEKRISDERQRFFSILDELPASVYLHAPEHTIRYANRYVRERFGDPDGKFCYELLRGRKEPCENCVPKGVFERKTPENWQWTEPVSGRVYNLSAFPFRDIDGSDLVLELGIDVTDRIRAEEALKVYTEKIETSNRELQDFAFVASHDLQEPLRKIQAFGGMLSKRYADSLDERAKDYVRRMQDASGRMQEMITALLDYSRVTTKAQPFSPVNLKETAKEAVSNLFVRIEETGGRVELNELPVIEAEYNQMLQLLQNLIGNALKYHKEGVPPVVRVTSEKESSRVRIFVEDNGIGFEEKYVDNIFSPFKRLHSREEYEGTGIGLTVCRKIVERHGGIITARSTPGEGSTFIIELPERQSA